MVTEQSNEEIMKMLMSRINGVMMDAAELEIERVKIMKLLENIDLNLNDRLMIGIEKILGASDKYLKEGNKTLKSYKALYKESLAYHQKLRKLEAKLKE